MDIMELGAIGELVGGVAVLATLVYLAVQTRNNTQAIRSSTYSQVADSFSALSLAIFQDPSAECVCKAQEQ